MEAIFNRRSVRKYKDELVENEKIDKILRAAMQAPSAGNQQPWEFIVVKEKDNLKKLAKMSLYSKPIGEAPVAILLLANEERMRFSECWQQDMGAAAQNILLEAVELGLGSLWLGVAPIEDREKYVKNIFDLQDSLKPYCVITLGYPAEGQENKFIDRYDETRIHLERF